MAALVGRLWWSYYPIQVSVAEILADFQGVQKTLTKISISPHGAITHAKCKPELSTLIGCICWEGCGEVIIPYKHRLQRY